jgi:murein tripeptide amidase MpaA
MRCLPAALALLAIASGWAQMPPRSGYEPPAAARAESLEWSTRAAPAALLTTAEKTQFRETGRYAESLELARRLERSSPLVRLVTLGRTPQGREIVMLVLSKERAFTPEAAAQTGKPVILIQNGIHAGEIAGKDATAMLLRDVAATRRYASWLDRVIVLAIPVFNVDGHERFSPYNRINQNGPAAMGFRATAQRVNLNRDYVKADTPEMRAWLEMYTAWLPDLLIDNHVTDGQDQQYDLTIAMSTEQDIWPSVGLWTKRTFLPALNTAMTNDGHAIAPYAEPLDSRDLSKGFSTGVFEPRFSTGYTAAQNRAGLLVETHSLKTYRTRVWAHYDVMRHAIDIVSRDAAALRTAVAAADREIANQEGRPLFLAGESAGDGDPFTFRGVSSRLEDSPITGGKVIVYGDQPIDIPTRLFSRVTPTLAPSVPLAYAVPREWSGVIDLLRLHGARTEPLALSRRAEVEVYRFIDAKWAERPYEGRHRVAFRAETASQTRTIPAGTVLVPMNQRAARIALNILEPGAPDSAAHWGFFDTVFEDKEYFSSYVMEPIAREMLKRDPGLRAEFEQRLKSDARFAASPAERLRFFYRRSPYADQEKDVYPVVRVIRWR